MKLFLSIRKINELIHSFEGPGLEILEKNNNIKLIVLVFKKIDFKAFISRKRPLCLASIGVLENTCIVSF